jgi:sulfite reductase (ferredoxin)
MSDVEAIKRASRNLRGTIAESLDAGGSRFSEDDLQLIKFHGTYQQEDRDLRQERKRAGLEPAYQFMLRSRIPGGVVSSEQYLVQDRISDRFGNGTLRITTRQGIQLHGILKGDLRATIREISASLLSTIAACGDVNRNVMTCPAPPKNDAEASVQALAHELALHFAPTTGAYHDIWIDGEKIASHGADEEPVDPIYGQTYLPRKFKMGVTLPGDNCIDVYTQDIGFAAILRDDCVIGYTLLVGGGMGSTHGKVTTYPRAATPFAFVTPDEAIEVASALLTTQRDFGDRTNRKHARFKYLVEERGIAWLRGEVEGRLGRSLSLPVDVPFDDVNDHLGWIEQRDGTFALGLYIENGRVKDAGSKRIRTGLREVVERFSPQIRLTGQQNILLLGIGAGDRVAVTSLLHEHGVETDPGAIGVRRYAMACPAAPTCGLAVAESERALPDLIGEIERELEALALAQERVSVRMTGCPNGCARPFMGDIGIVGRSKDLYDIYLGGDWANTRLNWTFRSSVRREDLVEALRPLFAAWKYGRADGETFGDYCERIGRDSLLELRAVPA